MSEIKMILSEKGKSLLVWDDYKFREKKVLKSGEKFWTCTVSKCNAKVFTLGSDNIISRKETVHNHENDIKKLNRQILSVASKRKAVEDITERPSKIIHSVLRENSDTMDALTRKDITYIRNNMYYKRRQVQARLPSNVSDVFDILPTLNLTTIKNEPFLLATDNINNIVVFSCYTNLKFLCSSDKVYLDGTFRYCTKHFLQLFTLHIVENGHYIPVAFCLLPNKLRLTYERLFVILKEKCCNANLIFVPKIIVADYELAIHKAISAQWPTTKIIGCRFHLGQAWYRKIQSLGLAKEYQDEKSATGKWMRYLFGLSFLKPEEVGECFALDLAEFQPDHMHKAVVNLADYLVKNYIEENSLFPPTIWAEAVVTTENSTNACESFHSRFNSNFYSMHPSLYLFVNVLNNFQTDTYIRINSLKESVKCNNKIVRRRLNMLTSKMLEYKNGSIKRIDFVKFASNYHKVY